MRLAIVPDYPQEGWRSMDLFASMLHRYWPADSRYRADMLAPPWRNRFTLLSVAAGAARSADRLMNRFITYPRYLRGVRASFDAFHIVDHSYAQLVAGLPSARVGVFCHDLDAFRCVLQPEVEPRPRWFRSMASRQLAGLQSAAVVFHTSATVRAEILYYNLVDPARLVQAPPGLDPAFVPAEVPCAGPPTLLHVGSCIPRKRVDLLLETFARLRSRFPDLRLSKVGGEFTPAQSEIVRRERLAGAIDHRHDLTSEQLADCYRRATLVMQTSSSEGFGMPAIEALACGAPVLASELPVFREVADDALVYCSGSDPDEWAAVASGLLDGSRSPPSTAIRAGVAARYSWENHARTIADAYAKLSE